MKAAYLYFCLMVISSSIFADVVIDKNGLSVKNDEIENLLKPAPANAQLGLLKNKDKFKSKLLELYLTKAVAEQSKLQDLTGEERAELDGLINLFYFQRKISQLANENLPEFEPLAMLQFEAHKADYVNPEKVAVEHILVDTKNRGEKEALKIVNDVLGQLKKGVDFATLAEKYSEDPSVKTNKGKLGLFSKGQMIKEFEDAAYALKINEISKPVKTQFGYHILRKYEHKEATPKTYAEVKDELVAKVKKEYIQARLDEYYEKVKKENEMKIDESAVDAYLADKTKQLEAKMQPPSAAPAAK